MKLVSGVVLASLLVLSSTAMAKEYPWVPMRSGDVRIFSDVKEDLAVRLALIRSARQSIDVAIYEQAADPYVGLPVLSALREAADRGVKVRFITTWIAQFLKDPKHKAKKYLLDPPTREPIQFVEFGGSDMPKGWDLSDSIHEKLLVIDNQVVLATGRGHSKSYLHWLDTSFLVRGNLVAEAVDAFGRLWRAVRADCALGAVKHSAKAELPAVTLVPSMELTSRERAKVDDLLGWLDQPEPKAGEAESAVRGRVLHFDLVHQWDALGRKDPGNADRLDVLDDPIIDALVELLPTAHEVRFTTLSLLMNPKLKAALIAAAQNGTHVVIQTNGPKAALDPFNTPFMVALPDAVDLLKTPGIDVYGLNPGKLDSDSPWTYLHRKLAVIDDTVIFGSHNLNLPSSNHNDELSFEVQDPTLAAAARERFDHDLKLSSTPITEAMAARMLKHSRIVRWIGRPLDGFF